MDRRQFFRQAARRTARTALDEAVRRAEARARHWFRPPFALPELDFLLACTRCGACVEACPEGLIFPLPARRGAQVVNTPALDLLNKACRLCEDWPCVAACEPGALRRPEPGEDGAGPRPRLAAAAIDPLVCLPYRGPECGACAGSCPVPGALLWDGERPRIDPGACTGCGACRAACISRPPAVRLQPPGTAGRRIEHRG